MIFPLLKSCSLLGACGGMKSGSTHILQMRSLRRQLPVAQFAMEQNVTWMDWCWTFFLLQIFGATQSHFGVGPVDLAIYWRVGIGPQAATFTFHRHGFWHLKLEKNDQIHPNCIIPSRCSKYKIAILWNSASVLPVLLSWWCCLTAGAGWWISHCLARFLRKALGLQNRGLGRGEIWQSWDRLKMVEIWVQLQGASMKVDNTTISIDPKGSTTCIRIMRTLGLKGDGCQICVAKMWVDFTNPARLDCVSSCWNECGRSRQFSMWLRAESFLWNNWQRSRYNSERMSCLTLSLNLVYCECMPWLSHRIINLTSMIILCMHILAWCTVIICNTLRPVVVHRICFDIASNICVVHAPWLMFSVT